MKKAPWLADSNIEAKNPFFNASTFPMASNGSRSWSSQPTPDALHFYIGYSDTVNNSEFDCEFIFDGPIICARELTTIDLGLSSNAPLLLIRRLCIWTQRPA